VEIAQPLDLILNLIPHIESSRRIVFSDMVYDPIQILSI